MTNVSQVIQRLYEDLGQVTYFEAESGTETTLVNSKTEITDNNLSGVIIVASTTDDGAPVYEFRPIVSFAPSSGTFTVAPAFSDVIGAGDVFGYVTPLYPIQNVIRAINAGLKSIGTIDRVDIASLSTANNQTEYTASLEWKYRPFRIDIQTRTTSSSDNGWQTLYRWEYIPAQAGSTGLIQLPEQYKSGLSLRVWYEGFHPEVSAYNDTIDENFSVELAAAAGIDKAALWLTSRTQGNNSFLLERLNDARDMVFREKSKFSVYKNNRRQKPLRGIGQRI